MKQLVLLKHFQKVALVQSIKVSESKSLALSLTNLWFQVYGTHSSILAWKIPWTEDPVGYNPRGHKELDVTKAT